MNEASQRIFLYLRLTSSGREIARTKIRELAGLASAMAELTGQFLAKNDDVPRTDLRLEYVEASSGDVLITLSTDLVRREQLIEGRIPARYRERMIDNPPRVDIDRYEERAGRHLDPVRRSELHDNLRHPSCDVLELIREAIRDDGTFSIRVPLAHR